MVKSPFNDDQVLWKRLASSDDSFLFQIQIRWNIQTVKQNVNTHILWCGYHSWDLRSKQHGNNGKCIHCHDHSTFVSRALQLVETHSLSLNFSEVTIYRQTSSEESSKTLELREPCTPWRCWKDETVSVICSYSNIRRPRHREKKLARLHHCDLGVRTGF